LKTDEKKIRREGLP